MDSNNYSSILNEWGTVLSVIGSVIIPGLSQISNTKSFTRHDDLIKGLIFFALAVIVWLSSAILFPQGNLFYSLFHYIFIILAFSIKNQYDLAIFVILYLLRIASFWEFYCSRAIENDYRYYIISKMGPNDKKFMEDSNNILKRGGALSADTRNYLNKLLNHIESETEKLVESNMELPDTGLNTYEIENPINKLGDHVNSESKKLGKSDSDLQSIWLLECQTCGYKLADPYGKLSAFYNCVKCGETHMRYRKATSSEIKKIKSKSIDSYDNDYASQLGKLNKQKTLKEIPRDADSILKHIYGDSLNFRVSSADEMEVIDTLVNEFDQPLLAEIVIKDGNKDSSSYIASQIVDEKLLIDIAKNALNRHARTVAIRKIRENSNNEDALIYIARHDSWHFNRKIAINGINDKSALNEMLNDSSILKSLTEPNYSLNEKYGNEFIEDVKIRLEKLGG